VITRGVRTEFDTTFLAHFCGLPVSMQLCAGGGQTSYPPLRQMQPRRPLILWSWNRRTRSRFSDFHLASGDCRV